MTVGKKSGSAVVRDGAVIHYTLHGETATHLPKLALIHPLGLDGTAWDWVVERLANRAAILTYDCRGHGASSKPPGPYRLETFANDLADLLTHVGWSRAHIAGVSLGGNVALQFAVLNPSRVETLGLIDTTAWYGGEPQNWEARARQAEERGLESLVEFQLARWFSEAFRAQRTEGVERCRSRFLANDVGGYAATCRMLGTFDLRPRLKELRMPCSIIVGEADPATPVAMAEDLKSGIEGATLEVIPGARHFTFVEYPGHVAGFLRRAMERSATQTASHAAASS